MRHVIAATLLVFAFANPAVAQAPNVQQLLQGLTTGNQNQDQALRDAFERGYQRGRQDEAGQQRSNRGTNDRSSSRGRDERNHNNDYRDDRGPDTRQGSSYNR